MRVGHRLFLAVVPAIVGLLTVAALAYFGEYARQAPEWLVAAAVVASIGSALLAWRNTRYVAHRVEQLAARRGARDEQGGAVRRAATMLGMALQPRPGELDDIDELDRIEHVVDRLTEALTASRRAQEEQRALLAQREREYEGLVAGAVDGALQQLEEVRLPLHILLENHFGELNENQEEMLGAARASAESVDGALLRLRDIVRLDLGEFPLRRERVRVQDVLQGIVPSLSLASAERGITIEADLPPTLPVVLADRGRLQDAISELLHTVLRTAADGAKLMIVGEHVAGSVRLVVRGGLAVAPSAEVALATRLVQAHGGVVEWREGALTVAVPVGDVGVSVNEPNAL